MPYQEFHFTIRDCKLRVTLRYNSIGTQWFMDVYDVKKQKVIVQGAALVVGTPILWRSPTEYYFYLTDEEQLGLDPIFMDDLDSRCVLHVGLKSEVLDEAI